MTRIMKFSTGFLYFLTLLMLLNSTATAAKRTVRITKLEQKIALGDYTCLAQDLLISTRVWDVFRCVLLCVEDDACQTMFYNKQEGQCRGCTARYTPASMPLQSPGFIHFQKTQTSCNDGWTHFQGSCYTLSPQGNFTDGVNYCETNNAHPVYVETLEENEFLKTYLANASINVHCFMGMTDSVHNGVWRYYGTNDLVTLFDFHYTEPTDDFNNSEQCVVFVGYSGYNYQWADDYCSDIVPTICEKSL